MKFARPLLILAPLLFSNTLIASRYCLQSAKGLRCDYQTPQGCEAERKTGEICLENPEEEADKNDMVPPKPANLPYCTGTYFGSVCIGYPQEPCDEKQKREDDFKCDFN